MHTAIDSGRISGRKRLKSAILGTASSAAILLLTGGAQAQAPAAKEADVEQVTVTGSRISIPGFQSPTPVTSVSQQDLAVKVPSQVQDLMNDIPQLTPFTGVSTGSLNAGLATFNLRGVGTNRTLVLLDGRRITSTTPLGGVDTGVIPTGMIRSLDVVTGGASAAYGSDAVSGVINVTLDSGFTGFAAEVHGGGTPHMDSMELGGSAKAGFGFDHDRGHMVVAVDAFTNNGFLQGGRSWGRQGYAIVPNPLCAPTCPAGQVKQVFINDVSLSKDTDGGVIVSGPLKYIQFGPAGVIEKFQPGTVVGANFMSGGDGAGELFHVGQSDNLYASVQDKLHRDSAYTHVSYDVTPDITVWGDALYSVDTNFYYLIENYNNAGDITVTRQNAFLPTAVASLMDANKITSFAMGRSNAELGWNGANGTAYVQRYAFGLDGSFGETWKWHAYFQNAANRYYFFQKNNRKEQAWKDSVDSVLNPAAASAGVVPVAGVPTGTPVCRIDTQPGFVYNILNPTGCVPVNLFGLQGHGSGPIEGFQNGGDTSWSPALINYIEGTDTYDETNIENDAAINITGQPFDDWAGPISVAFGAEHRFEGTAGTSDPLSQALGWKLVNAIPLIGKYTVDEGYLETEIPLAKNMPWAEDLNINAAGRITSYTTSGMVETWKVGLNWTPFDDLRVRATRSSDIRAANTSELFTARAQNSSLITDPRTNSSLQAYVVNGGNPNLLPETGNTVTAGAVYSPSWLEGLTMSADWYQLHITGAIATTAFQTIVNNCFGTTNVPAQPAFCSQVQQDSAGHIAFVFSTAFNSQAVQTDGWDFEESYRAPMDDLLPFLGFGGDFRLHTLASWTRSLKTVANNVTTETAGRSLPHWRWNVTATWSSDPWNISLEGRWIGNSAKSSTYVEGVDILSNKTDGRFTMYLTTSYQLNDHLQVYGRVKNIFDVDPPITPGSTNVVHAVGSTLYDTVGRDLLMGIKVNY